MKPPVGLDAAMHVLRPVETNVSDALVTAIAVARPSVKMTPAMHACRQERRPSVSIVLVVSLVRLQ